MTRRLHSGLYEELLTSALKAEKERLSGCKLPPLSQRSSVGWFENVAAVEMALVVEVVVDRGVNGGELLQGLDVPEPDHRSVSSAERLG